MFEQMSLMRMQITGHTQQNRHDSQPQGIRQIRREILCAGMTMARLQVYTRHIPDPPKGAARWLWQGIGAFAPTQTAAGSRKLASQRLINILVMRLVPRDYSSQNHKHGCFIKGGHKHTYLVRRSTGPGETILERTHGVERDV